MKDGSEDESQRSIGSRQRRLLCDGCNHPFLPIPTLKKNNPSTLPLQPSVPPTNLIVKVPRSQIKSLDIHVSRW